VEKDVGGHHQSVRHPSPRAPPAAAYRLQRPKRHLIDVLVSVCTLRGLVADRLEQELVTSESFHHDVVFRIFVSIVICQISTLCCTILIYGTTTI
jgi:hypothetical protein